MTLALATDDIQSIRVIDMAGRLTVFDKTFRETVQRFLNDGDRHFVLRMNNLNSMDAAGLGQLVSIYNSVEDAGGSLRLAAPNPRIRALLKITKLDTVLPIIEDEGAIR